MSDDKKRPLVGKRAPKIDTWDDLSSVVEVRKPVNISARRRPVSSIPPGKILPSTPPNPPGGPCIRGIKLFVIDDDPIRVDALAMDLRHLGAEVAVGDRSQSGYGQAVKFLPDAIVSDLVRPGDPGFSFIQNLRRHPLLRWSSVVLIRWWTEVAEGEGQVVLEPVLDQLEEALAPVRIIEERIATGRSVKERVEMTGPAALLRLISNAKLSGVVSLNDAWNHFTLEMMQGKLLSAYRKGIDGGSDDDQQALLQFLLCDSGRWLFKQDSIVTKRASSDTEASLTRANKALSRLFGPQRPPRQDLHENIVIRGDFLRNAAALLPNSPMTIPEAIAAGADYASFRATIKGKRSIIEAERILQTLFRSGTIRYVDSGSEDDGKAVKTPQSASVASLLRVLSEIPFNSLNDPSTLQWSSRPPKIAYTKPTGKGEYHRQNLASERLDEKTPKPRALRLEVKKPSSPEEASDEGPRKPSASITDVITDRPSTSLADPRPTPVENTGTEKMILESQQLALGDLPEGVEVFPPKENSHKWVAILLALILGGLLFFGIYIIASSGKSPHEVKRAPEVQ